MLVILLIIFCNIFVPSNSFGHNNSVNVLKELHIAVQPQVLVIVVDEEKDVQIEM